MGARERHKEKEKIGILLRRERKEVKKGDVRIRGMREKVEWLTTYRGTLLVFCIVRADTCA